MLEVCAKSLRAGVALLLRACAEAEVGLRFVGHDRSLARQFVCSVHLVAINGARRRC